MAAMNIAADKLVGSQEKQALFKKLCHRNMIRRQIGREPIDVPKIFHRLVQMKAVREFDRLIDPYLTKAFHDVEWPTGFTPRLLLGVKLYRTCVVRLCHEQNVIDPRTKNPNVLKIIERYAPDPENNVTPFAVSQDLT